jgi:hypothetical protein
MVQPFRPLEYGLGYTERELLVWVFTILHNLYLNSVKYRGYSALRRLRRFHINMKWSEMGAVSLNFPSLIKFFVSLQLKGTWQWGGFSGGFWRNWFLIDPLQLHYLSSRSDFGFEFAEIFIIEKRLPDSHFLVKNKTFISSFCYFASLLQNVASFHVNFA